MIIICFNFKKYFQFKLYFKDKLIGLSFFSKGANRGGITRFGRTGISIDKYCFLIQEKIAYWLEYNEELKTTNLKKEWDKEYQCPGAKHQEFMGPIHLFDLAIDNF